jgi:soluble lytic murein transglycosylase-like protein
MLGTLFCVAAIVFLALPGTAAELAVLRNGFNIRHDHHKVIGDTTRLYLSPDESSFTDVSTAEITGYEKDLTLPPPPAQSASQLTTAAAPAHSPVDLDKVVTSASATYHLDPDLVNSVIHAESGFNSHAVSPKGARGLMQLMPSTAHALGVHDAFDPEANVGGGSRYLRELLERYNFDLVKALAAYNAGPERVEQYRGVPPFHETRAYVARIVHDYNRKKIAQEKAAAQANKQALPAEKKSSPTRSPKGKSPAPAHAASDMPGHGVSASQLAASSATATTSPH